MNSFFSLRYVQFLLGVTALAGGTVSGRWLEAGVGWNFTIAFAVFTYFVYRLGRRLLLLAVLMLVFFAGLQRGFETAAQYHPLHTQAGEKVTVTGKILDDPVQNQRGRVEFRLGDLRQGKQSIPGSIKVQTHYQKLGRGYMVEAEGKAYESRGASSYRMGFAKIQVLSSDIGVIEKFRQQFFASIRSILPEPLSGFVLGILVGTRGLLDDVTEEQLRTVGLTHLVAVSGYNLTVIVQAVYGLLGRMGVAMATFASAWLIAGFLVITGLSAPIVRASLVSGLALFTSFYGYRVHPVTLLSIPAAITLAVNPDYLFRDIGWQLSFLAFFGILILAPLLDRRLPGSPGLVRSLVLQSICAYVMTLPVIALSFHNISLVAPLANVIIAPLVPLAMLLGFVSGVVGILSQPLGLWLGLPGAGIVSIILSLARYLSELPHAQEQIGFGWELAAVIYFCIICLTLGLWRGLRRRGERLQADVLTERQYT